MKKIHDIARVCLLFLMTSGVLQTVVPGTFVSDAYAAYGTGNASDPPPIPPPPVEVDLRGGPRG